LRKRFSARRRLLAAGSMRRRAAFARVWIVAIALLIVVRPAAATIRYRVSLAHPEQHLLHVTMEIPVQASALTIALPAWNNTYQVRDFAYRLREMAGVCGAANAAPLVPHKLDKQTWRFPLPAACTPGGRGEATVRYAIEWDEPGPFNSQMNSHHAFLNFGEILTYVPDRRAEDTALAFEDVPAGWDVATELAAGSEPMSFRAASYDALVDAPVEAGNFAQFEFDSEGAHFRVIVDAEKWNRGFLEDSLRRITKYELQLMGGPPFDTPRKEYTFIFHIGPHAEVGGGGMEHSNSTAVAERAVENALTVAAHELFHAWNVKRIRPQALEPVDYTKEQYTRALWFAEGVTSAYGAYTLERTGLWPKEQFYADLASQIAQLEARPARKWQSVEESSLDAWLEKYDTYNAPERSVSYYNKGQILGVLLDLVIRDATDNRKSLDDVMRRLYANYTQHHAFYNESEGIRAAAEETAGKSLEDFFRHYVSGTDDIPYDRFLAPAGLETKVESVNVGDIGFSPSSAFDKTLGVASVELGGPADAAGLRPGDTIVEWNGRAVTWTDVGALEVLPPGETVTFQIERRGERHSITYQVGTLAATRYSVVESPHASERQRRIRKGMLRGETD